MPSAWLPDTKLDNLVLEGLLGKADSIGPAAKSIGSGDAGSPHHAVSGLCFVSIDPWTDGRDRLSG